MKRRTLIRILPAAAIVAWLAPAYSRTPDVAAELSALEESGGGRLGVCLLDAVSGDIQGHRLDERFGMCSTFKLPLAEVGRISAGWIQSRAGPG